TDDTAAEVRRLAQADRRIRCIQRIGRRGLSRACVEGMLAPPAPYLAVVDGDSQHDETRLPEMLGVLRSSAADLVVRSRYVPGGSIGEWDPSRAAMTRLASAFGRV